MFREGIRWRVGSRKRIQILGQPWLLTAENPYITSDSVALQGNAVDSLLCMDKRAWDMEVIGHVLNNRDLEAISAIPLPTTEQVDKIYWRLEESGVYSVKSAYRLFQDQKSSRDAENKDKVWQILWSIKASPKVLNLVWRALTGTLPTLSQL